MIFNWKTHIAIGFVVGLYFHSFESIILTMVGSILPDIDHPVSKLGRHNPFIRHFTHRGFSHSILGCALLASPFLLLGNGEFLPVFVGAVSHVLSDFVSSLLRGYWYHVKLW